MVFEHMAHGDLHEFLISHSPKSDCSIDSDMDMRVLTQSEMSFIAIQIAAGMEYLSSHHYVHRDLAARNTLVEHKYIYLSPFHYCTIALIFLFINSQSICTIMTNSIL